MSKNTGGPAFPSDVSHGHTHGMTLRDYFAAKVMQGMASNPGWNATKRVEVFAKESYKMADAMLAERIKP